MTARPMRDLYCLNSTTVKGSNVFSENTLLEKTAPALHFQKCRWGRPGGERMLTLSKIYWIVGLAGGLSIASLFTNSAWALFLFLMTVLAAFGVALRKSSPTTHGPERVLRGAFGRVRR